MTRRTAAALLTLALSATPAAAEPTRPAGPATLTEATRRAGPQLAANANVVRSQARVMQPIVRRSSPPGNTWRKLFIAGGVLGGMLAGAYLGAAMDSHCACDSPGMRGAIIGAPVGALAGGILAARLTR